MDGWWQKDRCVYIMASKRDGVLDTGVTSQLFDRVAVHKQDLANGFTKKIKCICSSTTRCTRLCLQQLCARRV